MSLRAVITINSMLVNYLLPEAYPFSKLSEIPLKSNYPNPTYYNEELPDMLE